MRFWLDWCQSKAKILVPPPLHQDHRARSAWVKSEVQFIRITLANSLIAIGLFLPGFIYLDLNFSDQNPSWQYSLLHRGVPSVILLSLGIAFKVLSRATIKELFVALKAIVLMVLLTMIYFQFSYSMHFPDRNRIYPPLMMALAAFIVRTGTWATIVTVLVQVGLWVFFCHETPHLMRQDANYQLMGLVLTGTFYIHNQNRIKLIISQTAREDALKERNHALADYEKLLKVVCHDVANPLSAVLSYAELMTLDADQIPEEQRENLQKIRLSAGSMKAILDNAREYAAVESGKKAMTLVPTDLIAAFNESRLFLEAKLRAKKIELRIENHLASDSKVLAEPQSLGVHVLTNILSNAIKFSYEDSKIDVILSESDGMAKITIRDYGQGIPQDLAEHIFSSSKVTSRAGTQGEKGTGFGLPIVKTYLERLQGTIEVTSKTVEESPLGHGTSFMIFLKKAA